MNDPAALIHAFLGEIQLLEPRRGGGIHHVPLAWRRHDDAHETDAVTFGQACARNLVEPGLAGLWVNKGPHLVIALPGERVPGTDQVVSDPGLIPPSSEARIQLARPDQGAHQGPPAFDSLMPHGEECGAALFAGDELMGVCVLRATEHLAEWLGRLDNEHGERAGSLTEPPTFLHRTRRLFQQCWYAEMSETWSAGPYRIIRIRAPKVTGWCAMQGSQVLALDLRPREAAMVGNPEMAAET